MFTAWYGLNVYIRFRLIKIPRSLLRTTAVSILTSSCTHILIFMLLVFEGRAGKPGNLLTKRCCLSLSVPTSLLPCCSFYSPILQFHLSFSVLGNNRCLLRVSPSLPCRYYSTMAWYPSSSLSAQTFELPNNILWKLITHYFPSMKRFSRLRRNHSLAFVSVDRKRWRIVISVHTIRPKYAHV